MNARSGAESTPKSPVRWRLARLIDPAVPRQSQHPAGARETEGDVAGEPGTGGGPRIRTGTGTQRDGAASHGPAPDGTAETPAEPGAPRETADGWVPQTDPLEHPDAALAADAAATENLLRCWVRENNCRPAADGSLRIPLAATGTALHVPVLHWSPTGWHRFGPPRLDRAPATAAPADAVLVAALLGRESVHLARSATGPDPAATAPDAVPDPDPDAVPYADPAPYADTAPDAGAVPGAGLAETAAMTGRVADSVQRTAAFVTDRRAAPAAPPGTSPFLDAEQSLLLGHPLHPTPKSREGLSESESRAYSPELRASFPLHWMAVSRSVLAQDSEWREQGRVRSAEALARRFAGEEITGRLPGRTVPLPLHPWQARELCGRPDVARLLEEGLLHDLGPSGEAWHPTSSVRTVLQPGERPSAMLKLSLGLRITNSRRENLRKELLRGVEVHRLLRSGLSTRWQSAHPGFDIVRDAAWLGVDGADGDPVPGFDTVIRHNPFGPDDDAVCVAGLTSPRPWPGEEGALRSRLADVVLRLSTRTGRSVETVAPEWFLRYLDAVVRPVLWLDAHAGIALEAHQQNTVVLLDADGWPRGGRYRDNQGYYFRSSHRSALEQRLPGSGLGVASDSFVDDAVVDERFAYYLGINNVLGLVGAFGAQGLADEKLLLAAFRGFLEKCAKRSDGGAVSPLPSLLLDTPILRCKANLLTRLQGLDELVGPVDTQSVYVGVTNPLAT